MAGTVLAMGKMGKVASHAAGYVAHKIGSVFSSEKTDKDSGPFYFWCNSSNTVVVLTSVGTVLKIV